MEIVGITRLDSNGNPHDEFVVGCETHGYWYKGVPPLTHGCRECWHAYFYAQWAQAGAHPEHLDQLEEAIRHAAELEDKGQWDFKPKFDIKIDKDVN